MSWCAQGVTEAAILSSCGSTKDSLAALNSLLRTHRLALFTSGDGSRVFKAVGESDAVRYATSAGLAMISDLDLGTQDIAA